MTNDFPPPSKPPTGPNIQASASALANSPATGDLPTDKATRRVFHLFAVLISACFLLVGLSFFSFYSKFFRDRQMSAVRQAARVDLELIFKGEMAFHKVYGYYTSDLSALGLKPKKAIYKVGFVAPSPAHPELKGLDPSRMDLDKWKAAVPQLELDYSPLTKISEIDFSSLKALYPDCVATDQSFKILAVGDVDPAPGYDIWTLDDHGTLIHARTDGPSLERAAPANH